MKEKFNFDINKSLTKEEIHKRLTDQQIIEFYLREDITIGKKYKSPFREDNNPSLSFLAFPGGKIYWRDWGDTTMSKPLDVFEFVRKIHNCSFFDALMKINSDFMLNLDTPFGLLPPKRDDTIKIPEPREVKFKSASEKVIEVQKRVFSLQDMQYWLKYGIDAKTLAKFGINAVKYVWLDDSLVRVNSPSKPVFAYTLYDYEDKLDKFKIYSPFADKRQKWLTNAKSHVMQGVEQIGYFRDKIIITKSLKDVMVLDILGYDSVAPQSEGSPIPKYLIEDLISYYNGNVFCFYDNDPAGMDTSRKLCEEYPIRRMYLPLITKTKDISDFVNRYDMDEAKLMLVQLLKNSEYLTR